MRYENVVLLNLNLLRSRIPCLTMIYSSSVRDRQGRKLPFRRLNSARKSGSSNARWSSAASASIRERLLRDAMLTPILPLTLEFARRAVLPTLVEFGFEAV